MDSPAGTRFGVSSDYEDSLYDCEEVGDEGVDQLVDIIEEQADSQEEEEDKEYGILTNMPNDPNDVWRDCPCGRYRPS